MGYKTIWRCESCGHEKVTEYDARANDLDPKAEPRGAYRRGVEGARCEKCGGEALPEMPWDESKD